LVVLRAYEFADPSVQHHVEARVQRPLNLGGLGIIDLKRMGQALLLRWLWFQFSDRSRSWSELPCSEDPATTTFFQCSTLSVLGDGRKFRFWTDPWLDGASVQQLAPDLAAAVPKRRLKRRTVADALANGSWI
jgi:hypothetical protein